MEKKQISNDSINYNKKFTKINQGSEVDEKLKCFTAGLWYFHGNGNIGVLCLSLILTNVLSCNMLPKSSDDTSRSEREWPKYMTIIIIIIIH